MGQCFVEAKSQSLYCCRLLNPDRLPSLEAPPGGLYPDMILVWTLWQLWQQDHLES